MAGKTEKKGQVPDKAEKKGEVSDKKEVDNQAKKRASSDGKEPVEEGKDVDGADDGGKVEEAKEAEAAAEPVKKERKPRRDKKAEQIEELKERLMRAMAEFDNFRKRSEKEKSQMFEIGARSVVEKMLPVVDNFERGLHTVSKEEEGNSFVQGMENTYRHFLTTLEEMGVKPIEALGMEFNPDLHNAVMHIEDEGLDANVVAEELQKGYTYHDKVVRYSMVKVAN